MSICMRAFYEIGFCALCFKYMLCNVKGNPMLSGDYEVFELSVDGYGA